MFQLSRNATRRRVLFIAPQPFFTLRGTPLNLRAMAQCLAEQGFLVDLLCFSEGEDLDIPGVTIIRSARIPGFDSIPIGFSWTKILHNLVLLPKAISLLRKNHYDIVHGIEEGGVMAWICSHFFNIPYIMDMDSDMPDQLSGSSISRIPGMLALIKFLEKCSMRKASAIITVCQALTRRCLALAPDVDCFQIEDCPLDSIVEVDPQLKIEMSRKYDLESKFVFLYTGNLSAYQGLEFLLRSFASFVFEKQKIVDAKLVIVGGDGNSNAKLRKLLALAKSLKIDSQVVFTGERPVEEMGSFLSLADAVVSPRTEGENTPLKIYSYMQSGKPIVATRILSHTQVLNEDSAFLGDSDVESFANAMRSAADQSAEAVEARAVKVRNAKELLEKRYSKKQFMQKLLQSYQCVLDLTTMNYRIACKAAGQAPKVLVTGAAGFVGSYIVKYLRDQGCAVRAMVRKEEDVSRFAELGCEVVLADMSDAESLKLAVSGIEKIYHIAAIFRQAGISDDVYRDVNLEGTRRLFDAAIAEGVKRIVHCSTVGVHGDVENPPADESAPYSPGDIYQVTKMEGEKLALDYFRSGKMNGVVIRPAMIYGPGDMRTLKLFRMIAKKRFFYVGRGAKHVHFIDVRDLAKAFYLAMEAESKNGEVYIISGGKSLELKDFADTVASELGVAKPWVKLPVKPVQLLGSCVESVCVPFNVEPPIYRRRVDFYTKHRQFSSKKARQDLGFTPGQDLKGEIRDICNWYIDKGYIDGVGGSPTSLKKHVSSVQAFVMALVEFL